MKGRGHYDRQGRHICECGERTTYRMFSGGQEFYCPSCKLEAYYPAGEGGPRARLLTKGEAGIAELKRQMYEEIAKRKSDGGTERDRA